MEVTALPKEKLKGLVHPNYKKTKQNKSLLVSSLADIYGISVSQISVFDISVSLTQKSWMEFHFRFRQD